jgi:hypothetical protein
VLPACSQQGPRQLARMDMLAAVGRLSPTQRWQYTLLVGVRALSGCAKSISELVSAELLLQLCNGDHARVARTMATLASANTVSDFAFNPFMGAVLDSHGRRQALMLAQLADAATTLTVPPHLQCSRFSLSAPLYRGSTAI